MNLLTDSPIIRSHEDVYLMLDDMFQRRDSDWWDDFYSDKSRSVPFFRCIPDENLHSYIEQDIFTQGKILDIGCGIGRNAIYLAKCGFIVDAIDFSKESIKWAEENANAEHVSVHFICDSIFEYHQPSMTYDYVYDGGCFHHIKPHRRSQYLSIVSNLLKPRGFFAMTCFNLLGAANISDYDVYRDRSMHGGMGYSEHKIRTILKDYFEIIELGNMKCIKDENLMGLDFLWTILMQKK